MSALSRMIRSGFGRGDRKRDKGLTTPEDIVRYDDIVYGRSKKWQSLDVYHPKESINADGSLKVLPVIVSIHGGAWIYGSKEVYQWYCMNLAQRGFAVVNFTYRLAPEYKYPSGIEDSNKVFQWVLDHATEYGFDTDHIFAVGDSAGGHMLSICATMYSNPKFAEKFPFEMAKKTNADGTVSSFKPAGVALNCGVYQLGKGKTKEMDKAILKELLAEGGSKKEIDLLNPMPYMTSEFPPAFIMTANNDTTVDAVQAKMLKARLTELGTDFTDKVYGSKENPLGHVFHCNIKTQSAKECNDDECAFFQKYVK